MFYRKNLPHIQPPGETFFITYRLAGSLPLSTIENLKSRYRQAERRLHIQYPDLEKRACAKYDLQKKYFAEFDDQLDKCLNEPYWLKEKNIAALVAESLDYLAKMYFDLWAFCIMPNHVHLLITVFEDAPILYKILQKHKKHTAWKGNLILKRSGKFWTHESYDHIVRNGQEFENIVYYILNNPIKAGFVKKWQDWQWTYLHPEL